jgi:hypothetical protein
VVCSTSSYATAVLEWDANPESSVAGYNVYLGNASRSYSQVIDVGLQTSYQLTNVNVGVTYFIAVTAYDSGRLESPFSDEVIYTLPVNGTNAAVLPSQFSVASGSTTLRFNGRTGQQCRIVASSDLQSWESIYEATLSDGTSVQFSDPASSTKPMRFYRIIVTPP